MFGKYRSKFYAYDLEDKFFQTKISKFGESMLRKIPDWIGYVVLSLYFALHFVFAIGISYLLTRNLDSYPLSVFIFWILVSIYYVSKLRFQSASKSYLLDMIEENSFEIQLFEDLLEDKTIHFLRPELLIKDAKISPVEYLKDKLGDDYQKLDINALIMVHRNQQTNKLDAFFKELKKK